MTATAQTPAAPFTFNPVTTTIGAEVVGVDPSAPQSPETAAELRRVLHEYGVLFFDGAGLDDAGHKAFAALFGDIHVAPYTDAFEDPQVLVLDSLTSPSDVYRTDRLHTDGSYEQFPPGSAVLRCAVVPERGGDTLWASMYAAYEALSSPLQAFLDGLEALHSNAKLMTYFPSDRDDSHMKGEPKTFVHPVVITDPVTNRRALYVNGNYTVKIVGLSDDESDAVLAFLFNHVKDPGLHVRLHWADTTVAVWEERITQHCAAGAQLGRRVLRRVTLDGGPVE
jgi:taurine dioxygenase